MVERRSGTRACVAMKSTTRVKREFVEEVIVEKKERLRNG